MMIPWDKRVYIVSRWSFYYRGDNCRG